VSWQVVPRRLTELLASPDRAAAKRAMEAMLEMGKIDVSRIEAAAAGEPVGTR
jgi:predicted 3-demethylubiquinone-9 3-methyltransferase (glyoxalase superfamily)